MSITCIEEIENHWKTKTSIASEYFENKQFSKALARYNDALYRAEVLNKHAIICKKAKIPFIQVFVISCNNLAYTYEALNLFDRAETMLKRAIYFLIHLSEKEGCEKEMLKSELSRATIAYTDFMSNHDHTSLKNQQILIAVKGAQ